MKSLYVNLLSGRKVQELVSAAPDESSRSRYARVLMAPPARDTDELIAMANDCVNRIRTSRLEKRLNALIAQAGQASGAEADQLMQEAQEISRQLSRFQASGRSS